MATAKFAGSLLQAPRCPLCAWGGYRLNFVKEAVIPTAGRIPFCQWKGSRAVGGCFSTAAQA